MAESTLVENQGQDMSVAIGKEFEPPLERQRFVVRFTSEKADLEAQELLGRIGEVYYFENGDARIDGRQLAVLKGRKIHFELISPRPVPVSNSLRK